MTSEGKTVFGRVRILTPEETFGGKMRPLSVEGFSIQEDALDSWQRFIESLDEVGREIQRLRDAVDAEGGGE